MAFRNLLATLTARRLAAAATAGIGIGTITVQVQEPMETQRRTGPAKAIELLMPRRAACEGVADSLTNVVIAGAVAGAGYYGYTKYYGMGGGGGSGASGLPAIGTIPAGAGEPMIYKEAVEAINRGDNKTGVKFLTAAASEGSASAALKLSEAYFAGIGTDKSAEKGMEYLAMAAHAGHPTALTRMGAIYDTGEGVEVDIPKANAYFQAAYDRGSPHAAFLLSWSYDVGETVPKDQEKAKELLAFAIANLAEGDRTRSKAQAVLAKIEESQAAATEAAAAPAAAAEEEAAAPATAAAEIDAK